MPDVQVTQHHSDSPLSSDVGAVSGIPSRRRLRVLLVPDSIHWITGTIASSIVAHNPWINGTIISGPVLDIIARNEVGIFEAFDLAHFVCPYASRAWLHVLRDRMPTVTSHHHVGDDYELQRHNLNGDAIIVGSSQWADNVVERGASRDRVICVPYGVNASHFSPVPDSVRMGLRGPLGIAADAIVVGFFAKKSSNEHDRKGTDIFISAIRLLARDLPSLAVLIIGPGWDNMVAQLRSGGVRCVWLPFVNDAERMPDMFRVLDFYWVTARIEGGPVTLLEAMSTGLCCITTPVGLARDIVVDRVNAIVVNFDDYAAFAAETLDYVKRDTDRRDIGARARATILETMDVPVTSQGVHKAYEVAVAKFAQRTSNASREAFRIPRESILSGAILGRIAILEQLVWAEALILQDQRSLALRIMTSTWLRHPLSSLPPRFILRNVLPQTLVRALVRAKNALAGNT